jgi:VWFA-related protein
MIRRHFFPVLWCAAAWAQLPAPQAPPPRADTPAKLQPRRIPSAMRSPWRVDAVATAADGKSVPDLTAEDFELSTDGKAQKVTAAEFQPAASLRVALMVDDLSLAPENLALLQKALHGFVANMRPGDEAAILRASACDGRADQFTSDRSALDAAIDRLRSSRPTDESHVAFLTGSVGALRAALLGLQFTPGRKLAVFFSERLRANDRTPDATWVSRLLGSANRSSAVLYAVDVTSSADPSRMLEQGLAGAAPQTGGGFFDAAGDPAAALARIVESQKGYYILRFETEPMQRTVPLVVKTQRPGVRVRARNGVLGLAGDDEGRGFVAPENQLRAAVASALFANGMHLELMPKPGSARDPYLDAVLHLNTNEVTLALGLDGRYHGDVTAMVALFQENDSAVSQVGRGVDLHLTPEERQKVLESGFDLTLRLPLPKKGPYQLRAAVLDDTGGRLGAAARFFELADLPAALLTMAPIEMEPSGNPPRRVYPPGQPVRYSYDVANLRNDGADHAKLQVTNQLLREGQVIFAGEPRLIEIGLSPQGTSARINGTVKLGAEAKPGKFTLTITVTDTLAAGADRRAATQKIDFEIQP